MMICSYPANYERLKEIGVFLDSNIIIIIFFLREKYNGRIHTLLSLFLLETQNISLKIFFWQNAMTKMQTKLLIFEFYIKFLFFSYETLCILLTIQLWLVLDLMMNFLSRLNQDSDFETA